MVAVEQQLMTALPGVPRTSTDGILQVSPRGRIMDAMTAAVAERGYATTSIADVLKRARASRSTFYEQFTDKEDCYLAAYRIASDYVAGRLAEAASAAPPGLPARVDAIYRTYLEELCRYPLAARAFIVEIRASGPPSQEHLRAVRDQFADLLHLPDSADSPLLRLAVVAATDEIVGREIIDRGTARLTRLLPDLIDLAIRLLAPG